MIKILKGDTSADISFALAEGFDYSGATVHVEYQGAVKTFTGCAAGDVLALRFSADETAVMSLGSYPVVVRITNPSGLVKTIQNSNTKICVTDDPAEVSGGAIALDVRGMLYGIEDLPERWTEADIVAKLREIMRRGGAVLCALLTFSAFGASVQTARKDAIYNDAQIVTNVIFDAAPDFTTNNQTLVDTIVAKSPPPDMSGVVHGDDRAADKAAFPANGIKLRAADDDGGNLRFRIGDPSGVGLRYYSDSTGTTLGNPWFALTAFGITHPSGSNDTPVLTDWFDFTRAHTVLDTMPGYVTSGAGRENYIYPISAGAFLDYFWNIYNLPTEAANRFADTRTMKAASNLVDNAGSLVRAEDIEERAAQLTATSTVPIYAYSAWTSDWPGDDEVQPLQPVWSNGNWSVTVKEVEGNRKWGPYSVAGAADAITFTVSIMGYATTFNRTKTETGDLNAYGLARMSDLPSTNGLITEATAASIAASAAIAATDGLLSSETDPYWESAKGEYAKTGAVNAVSAIVNAWEGYWDGTNVIFEVTNYYGNTSGEIPRLRIKELRDGAWQTVWDEANKFTLCESNLLQAVSDSNRVMKTDLKKDFAPIAWGTVTDKGTPNVVSNCVWMTSPETYFAGGTEYQRVAVGSGAICVLVDNGAGTYTAGEEGTFRFQDEGGTNYFGFAKSDSYTIGCRTDGIAVEGTLVTLRYDVIMGGNDVPIIYYRQTLSSGEWVQLNNADGTAAQGAPYTVTWYTESGSYYAAINCGGNPSGFFKAETSVAGDVVFETNMKARLDGGIECPNTANGTIGVIRPTYNGSTVTWSWSAK